MLWYYCTIVHYLTSGLIENCSFNGTITNLTSNSRYGAGGIIAHMFGGTVRNCRVSGSISGVSYAGGIVGQLTAGDILNCTVDENTQITAITGTARGIAGTAIDYNGNMSGNAFPSRYEAMGEAGGPVILPETNIELIEELTDDQKTIIAQNLSEVAGETVKPEDIRLLSEDNLMPAREPTPEMNEQVKSENYQLVYKLENTFQIFEEGYYTFSFDVPPELVGQPIDNYKIYMMSYDDLTASHKVLASFGFWNSIYTLIDGEGLGVTKGMNWPEKILFSGFFPVANSIFFGIGGILWRSC